MFGKPALRYLLFCLGISSAHAQEMLIFRKPNIQWSTIEKQPTSSQVETFIAQNRKDFPQFHDKPEEYQHSLDELRSSLHFLDLDGDHQLDVIYDGISGGEPNQITLYLKRGKAYVQVLSTGQAIVQIRWRNSRLYKLYISDDGCCDDPVTTNKVYQADYSKPDDPKLIQIFQEYEITGTTFPDTLVEKPFRFEVLNPQYNIRMKPAVDDTSDPGEQIVGHPHYGNSIGMLAKGARGTAYAKKIDATGREWWFVEMDAESYPPSGSFFLPDPAANGFATKITGWISSRFVKRL